MFTGLFLAYADAASEIATCDQCERRPGLHEQANGAILCTECDENANEDAWERQQVADFESHHGSNGPTNDQERDAVHGRRPW